MINKPRLVEIIKDFRRLRVLADTVKLKLSQQQPGVLMLLREFDPLNNGVTFAPGPRGTAYRVEPEPKTGWDHEKVMAYISSNRGIWTKCTSRVVDYAKFEACVKSLEIPPEEAERLRTVAPGREPYVRFGPRNEDSL